MDAYLTASILQALTEGDLPKVMAYIAIFVFIWIEVRGMKKQLIKLNETMADFFSKAEKRFDTLEQGHVTQDHRITVIESHHAAVMDRLRTLEFIQQRPKEGL